MKASAHGSRVVVPTRVGPLNVEVSGSGSPALLWHSLFVDSTTWGRLRPVLATQRRLVLVDGPNHGENPRAKGRLTLEECVGAATDILDELGIDEPVDWLGNAWGGHVGILFAAEHSDRCRTLMTIGTPVHALSVPERRRVRLLSALYLTGGTRPVTRPLIDALLGPATRNDDPAGAAIVRTAFRRAGRRGMFDAIRWLSLNRPDLTPVLDNVQQPTMLVTAQDDPMWTVPQTQAAAGHLHQGTMAILPGVGHIGPLLYQGSATADLVTAFWHEPVKTIDVMQAA